MGMVPGWVGEVERCRLCFSFKPELRVSVVVVMHEADVMVVCWPASFNGRLKW